LEIPQDFFTNPSRAQWIVIREILQKGGVHVISSSNEAYGELVWTLEKRRALANKGVPEAFLKIQDLVQKGVAENLGNLNTVYHRKFMIVDGTISWVGSLNIGLEYIYSTPLNSITIGGKVLKYPTKKEEWRDGMMIIKGNDHVQHLHKIFCSQWMALGGDIFDWSSQKYIPPKIEKAGNVDIAILPCFPGNPLNIIHRVMTDAVQYGEKVTLLNPYIVDKTFWKILKEVKVEQYKNLTIITPLKINDHPTHAASVYANMLNPVKHGMKCYSWGFDIERFSHWKIALFESADTVFHGSYNLNTRSAIHDFELNVLLRSKEVANTVKDLLAEDILLSKCLEEKDFPKTAQEDLDRLIDNPVVEYFG